MAVDAVTLAAVEMLSSAGVETIVLKGPSIAQRLYSEDPNRRPYNDVDLLIDPADLEAALVSFQSAGFQTKFSSELERGISPHAVTLVTEPDPEHELSGMAAKAGVAIDLHTSFHGVDGPPHEFWRALRRDAVTMRLGPREVLVPNDPALALIISLHVVAEGRLLDKARRDLERALALFDARVWEDAAHLARAVGAEAWFSTGLRSSAAGMRVAEDLGLPTSFDPLASALLEGAPIGTEGLIRVRRERSLVRRGAILAREIYPSRSFMDHWHRFHPGTPRVLARPYRLLLLLANLPAALRHQSSPDRGLDQRGERSYQSSKAGNPQR